MNTENGLTVGRLRDLLSYDPDTGVLTWKVTRGSVKAGEVAGWKERRGYVRVSIDGKQYVAHRCAWAIVHGHFPAALIDHRNGNPSDNRLANLREANRSQNGANAKGRSALGMPKGVSQSGNKFKAKICVGGKAIYLGSHPSADIAHAAYVRAANDYFGSFARAA